MTDSILVLGRQPALGLAELESIYGADSLALVRDDIVRLQLDPKSVDFNRLGGSVKLAKMLTDLPYTDWPRLVEHVSDKLSGYVTSLPEGKFKFGLSVYGLDVKVDAINRAGLSVKKIIQNSGRSTRIVPNKEPWLNSAQVLHNSLTGPLGMELLLIQHGSKTVLAQTIAEQDIEAYAKRDQARPKRDARIGMLPPKLAQIIINLARPDTTGTVLDPFCGTGVVLQEAILMGFAAYGSDIDERMVEYTHENVVQWLMNNDDQGRVTIEHGDATNYQWQSPYDAIASETYLGQPFSALPAPEKLHDVIQITNTIVRKFLQNLKQQTPKGLRLCLAVPAWKTKTGFSHLPTLDKLSDLGYNRLSFKHARDTDLIYFRPDQIVARELVTLIRN